MIKNYKYLQEKSQKKKKQRSVQDQLPLVDALFNNNPCMKDYNDGCKVWNVPLMHIKHKWASTYT